MMKTLTVQVPEHLNDRIKAMASRQRVSKSALVRDTLLKAMENKVESSSASIHSRLSQYQDAGLTGIRDLASNPKHLAAYGRE